VSAPPPAQVGRRFARVSKRIRRDAKRSAAINPTLPSTALERPAQLI
jgi:hypothetical protein